MGYIFKNTTNNLEIDESLYTCTLTRNTRGEGDRTNDSVAKMLSLKS